MDLSEFRLMTPAKCSGLSEPRGPGRGTALPDFDFEWGQTMPTTLLSPLLKIFRPSYGFGVIEEGKPRSSSTSYEKIDFGTQKNAGS